MTLPTTHRSSTITRLTFSPSPSIASETYFLPTESTNVYELKAGATTPVTLASSFNQAQGVAFDPSGNLYVSDWGNKAANAGAGIYEIPFVAGALNPADTFLVFPFILSTPNGGYDSPDNIGTIGVAVDQHGNVFATQGYNDLSKFTIDNASFPATAIGKTSAVTTLTLAFNGAITLKSTAVSAAAHPPASSPPPRPAPARWARHTRAAATARLPSLSRPLFRGCAPPS
jgi:sugar lactone lactonase YvrE